MEDAPPPALQVHSCQVAEAKALLETRTLHGKRFFSAHFSLARTASPGNPYLQETESLRIYFSSLCGTGQHRREKRDSFGF